MLHDSSFFFTFQFSFLTFDFPCWQIFNINLSNYFLVFFSLLVFLFVCLVFSMPSIPLQWLLHLFIGHCNYAFFFFSLSPPLPPFPQTSSHRDPKYMTARLWYQTNDKGRQETRRLLWQWNTLKSKLYDPIVV